MVINERSWHYRLYRFYASDLGEKGRYKEPTNLCQYFWSLVGYSILFGAVGIIIVVIAVFYAIVIAIPTLVALIRRQPMPWNEEEVKRAKEEKKRERQPGLVRSYFAAKKARVCPLITIQRDE